MGLYDYNRSIVTRGVLRQRSELHYHDGSFNDNCHITEHYNYNHNYPCHYNHHRNIGVYNYNYDNHYHCRTNHAHC
jgi:hypothetical protein